MAFDVLRFANAHKGQDRFSRRIAELAAEDRYTDSIVATVNDAMTSLAAGTSSFVIYGEPQSGKTEMMIALTARLLDSGRRIVVVLINDNVQLLNQNLSRFREAGLDPAPRNFLDVLDEEVQIDSGEWIIFCKKNPNDLRKLIDKLSANSSQIVVLDDEADYATPNAKINSKKGEQTRINQLVGELLGGDGIYIGVTATPARLNLNNTFDNDAGRWTLFAPHPEYVGHQTFFPLTKNSKPQFILNLLPDAGDKPEYLREALFRFLVNVAYLNSVRNKHRREQNYCMLIHTSGIKVDHSDDYKEIVRIMNVLTSHDPANNRYKQYVTRLHQIAAEKYPYAVDDIMSYIGKNAGRYVTVVMNSNNKAMDYSPATNPTTPFTIAIGGNIVSRGVTFNNLLSMFFTRDVKHKIQQDTYIQRARMFGSRLPYLEHFELAIPRSLYADWSRCFAFHTLALESVKTGDAPVWLEDSRISAASSSSINKATVNMDSGEMAFDIFEMSSAISEICLSKRHPLEKLRELQNLLGTKAVPQYLIEFIENIPDSSRISLEVHPPASMANFKDANQETISRKRGFISSTYLKGFEGIDHHVRVYYNDNRRGRLFYKFSGKIRFLRNERSS